MIVSVMMSNSVPVMTEVDTDRVSKVTVESVSVKDGAIPSACLCVRFKSKDPDLVLKGYSSGLIEHIVDCAKQIAEAIGQHEAYDLRKQNP